MARWCALIVALVLCAAFGSGRAETVIERLVSPGPLSRAHHALETRCTACHVQFQRSAQPDRCLSCHTGIARDIATHRRWHGLVAEARPRPCSTCHAEHRGRDAKLAVLDRSRFHHDTQTAYRLTGGHARVQCAACHIGMVRFRETPQACAACHARADVHRGRLGPQCQSCHTTARWRDVLPFDHDRTRYPLTGAHVTTACTGCHVAQQWRGVASTCVACHAKADVHQGADGPHCAQCHGTQVWRTIRFDHDRVAAFALRGAHRPLPCKACHARAEPPKRAPVACNGCHARDDVHRGADGPKCADCHSQITWKVAKFDHAQTRFPLIGAHQRVTCVACHPQSVNTVKPASRCIDCHRKDDVHRGALGEVCERCHKQTSFVIPCLPRVMPPARATPPRDFPRSGLRN